MKTLMKSNGTYFPTMPSLFDDFFARDLFSSSSFNQGETLPSVNIRETDEKFELELAAPGLSKEDFNVDIQGKNLIITVKKENQAESKDNKGNYTRKEFSYQSFIRSFSLPEAKIKIDNITAKYENGILFITIPKENKNLMNPSKRIEIL